jgi:hypothetical protein
MNTSLSLWPRSLAACLVLTLSAALLRAESAAPQIVSIRTNRASLLVTAKVPKGWQAVRLESREYPYAGAWVPRAVARSGLSSGKVVFKVPVSLKGQSLQVLGLAKEPLAESFYKGKHTFARRKSSFWQPDQGRGEVFSVTANGSLPGTAMAPAAATASRSVVESDIWKVSGDTLYFFNQLRGLQIIDISQPDAPVVRGTLPMPAVGEDMYLLDAQHVVLLTRDGCGNGWESQVTIVDVSGPAPQTLATLPVPGWLDESRLVGQVLYVASEGYDPASGTNIDSAPWGTVISSFDLSHPAAPITRSMLWFAGTGNAVLATDRFFFVAVTDWSGDTAALPEVRIIDISAADGTLRDLAGLRTSGEVEDKFKMNLNGQVFSVVSDQFNDTPDGGGDWVTTLETFSLANPAAPAALGHLELAQGEQLFATRFDGNRAYIVTAQQIDPLWVVDLSDPAHPAVAGSVDSPGWVSYIDVLGDRLLTLGYVSNQVAVSLFDVHDPAQPALLSRVPLGQGYSWSEATYDDKALTVLTDLGLILVPFEGDTGDGWANRVQLIDLGTSSLTERGMIEHRFAPRRSTAHNGRLLSVSNQDLLSVDATDRDHPVVTQDTPLAWPVDRVFALGGYLLEIANGSGWRGSAFPAVRVASAGQPDSIVNTLTLTNLPIVGLTLRSNLLYILQSPFSFYGGPLPMLPIAGGSWAPTAATNLLMTIADVSALPTIQVRSQLTIAPNGTLGGSFEAVWPTPDLLVWFSTGFGFWINPLVDTRPVGVLPGGILTVPFPGPALGHAMPIAVSPMPATGLAPRSPMVPASGSPLLYPPIASGLAPRPGMSFPQPSTLNSQPFLTLPYWRPWWGNGGARLLTLNVSDPVNPQLLSQLSFAPTNAWGFSKPFAAQGLVYFTHEQPTNVAPAQAVSSSMPTRLDWRVNDLLDVVDLADPTTPTVRPPVNVPGQLTGLSDDGAVIYLLGNAGARAGAAIDSREAVNACAYDGVAAYMLDSLPLAQCWPRPVLVRNGLTYLASAAAGGRTTNTLESWSLSEKGRFTRLAQVQTAQPLWALGLFGSLLAAQSGDAGVSLFNTSSPTALRPCGQGGPAGCLWFDLNSADGALSAGLWLPLDDYGVAFVPVSF